MPTAWRRLAKRRVARALEILRADVDRTLKLLGCTSIAALDRSYVDVPDGLAVISLRVPSCPWWFMPLKALTTKDTKVHEGNHSLSSF